MYEKKRFFSFSYPKNGVIRHHSYVKFSYILKFYAKSSCYGLPNSWLVDKERYNLDLAVGVESNNTNVAVWVSPPALLDFCTVRKFHQKEIRSISINE